MDRRKLFAIAAGLLVIINIVWYIWANWGLITINAEKEPLFKVVRSIEKQGHVTLKTDMDINTPVSMHVCKVPLTEALETLAAVTDARWQVDYILAADKASLISGIENFTLENKSADWKLISYPMPQTVSFGIGQVPDPRYDTWPVKAPQESALQPYLTEAAQAVNIGFAVPQNWNPIVKQTFSTGQLRKIVPQLAKASGSKMAQIFLLTKERGWRGFGRRNRDGQDGDSNFDWMALRAQNDINHLPPEERANAQADFDAERAFRQQMRGLEPAQRQQKMMEHMKDPDVQARMDQRQANQDKRRTPEQREARYSRYIQAKAAAAQARQQ